MAKEVSLTIAGSDSSGGAGIQADLKAFQLVGVEGASVITCCVAENTQKVYGIVPLSTDFIAKQIKSVFDDLNPRTAKTGMLYSKEIVKIVSSALVKYGVNPVVDPVLVASVGDKLSKKGLVASLIKYLIPSAKVITPNRWEASELTGMEVKTLQDAKEAAEKLHQLGAKRVLIKEIDQPLGFSSDLLFDAHHYYTFSLPRISKKVHGSGCAFSALIAGYLAKGIELSEAVSLAKRMVWIMIRHSNKLGKGLRTLNFEAPSTYPLPHETTNIESFKR
jgi:hydroxymethylpyrimidine/phosphomethylpyrimidine kinase